MGCTPEQEKEMFDWLRKWPGVAQKVEDFIVVLKRRQIWNSHTISRQTSELLRTVIGNTKWTTACQIMDILRTLGAVLAKAQPVELVMGNIIRRVLYIIREEYMAAVKDLPEQVTEGASKPAQSLSLHSILTPSENTDFSIPLKQLKNSIMEGMVDVLEELETSHENIADQALEHIHANEVILTYGRSKTVEEFLKAAAKKRQFKVFVVESAPGLDGHEMARSLAQSGIDTTLITDSAVFAMMARVNKVVISASKVVANGGLVALSGVYSVALAAKECCIPVVCTVGLYKLTPLYPHDLETLNDLVSPGMFMDIDTNACGSMDNINVLSPVYDYVPPELVDLFITNIGGHQPSYIYRLLAEYYSPEDYSTK